MKTKLSLWLAALAGAVALYAAPLETGFFYQGLLTDATTGKPNPGKANFEFYFNTSAGATSAPTGPGVTNSNVEVTDGVFTTVIDFGANVFDGRQYWLEIGVRTNGSTGPFTILSPRQPIRPTPYALHAATSATVATNGVGNSALAANAVSGDKIAPAQVVKGLNGLRDDVQLSVEGDLDLRVVGNGLVLAPIVNCNTYTNCYWSLYGNGNITAGKHFLGTTANEFDPLEFRVNDNRSMLHVFSTASDAPKLIGGYGENTVNPGGYGSVIGGGGRQGGFNQVFGQYDVVAGGYSNQIGSQLALTHASVISGGHDNLIDHDGDANTIAGGVTNLIDPYTIAAVIGGGERNINRVSHGVIGGGRWNLLEAGGVISGGERNWIEFNATHSTIGGGITNRIEGNAGSSTISGGGINRIGTDSAFVVIGGGGNNQVGTNSPDSTIAGGRQNVIDASSAGATISGGVTNRVVASAFGATIGGGSDNLVTTIAPFATVPGGQRAAARSYGQIAYASGSFASHGDAQAGVYVLRNTTTTNSGAGLIADLFLDGASRRIRVPADAAWTFEISIAARDAAGNSAAYLVRGTIENNAGTTAFPIQPVIDTLNEDVVAWGVQLIADNANDALVVRVTGSVAAPVRWVATVRSTEVMFP